MCAWNGGFSWTCHYSLIIPNDSRLSLEGGLDYQRIGNLPTCEQDVDEEIAEILEQNGNETDCNIGNQNVKDDTSKSLEDRLDKLEEKLVVLQNRCDLLEKENVELVKEISNKRKKQVENECTVEEEMLSNLKKGGFKRQNPQVQPEPKSKKIQFMCDKCDCVLESRGLLNAHLKIHSGGIKSFECGKCNVVWLLPITKLYLLLCSLIKGAKFLCFWQIFLL